MSDLDHMSKALQQQYTGAYGPFVSGDYAPGQTVSTPSTSGEIIWSYQSRKGVVYVVDDGSGFPVECLARDVREAK